MRVLVTGGRSYTNRLAVYMKLDDIARSKEVELIIHGAASGADTLAGEWARERGVEEWTFPIEPGESGFSRNTRMLSMSEPDVVVRFPGGNGTRDMVTKAHIAGVLVVGGLARMTDDSLWWGGDDKSRLLP